MAHVRAGRSDPVGIFRRPSARLRVDWIPPGAARYEQAVVVGPGSHGNPRKRADPPPRSSFQEPHPRRSARCARRPVGDGGRNKMLLPLCRRRRALGRSWSTRFHGQPTACSCIGAVGRRRLSDPSEWPCQFERSAHALADCKSSLADRRSRSTCSRTAGVGCRAVPCTRFADGSLEPRS